MNRRWGQLVAVGVAVLAVLTVAFFAGRTDPAEILWTECGAVGSVYGWLAWRRRWLLNEWRKRNHINGLFAIVCEQHVNLRGLGFGAQILILIGGFGAMLDWHRWIIIGSVIGVAVLATLSVWYAERKAEQQAAYVSKHPEEFEVKP